MNQDFSVVLLDDGCQVNLCPFVEGKIHLPDLLLKCILVKICVVAVLLKHGGHHGVVQDHVEFRKFR